MRLIEIMMIRLPSLLDVIKISTMISVELQYHSFFGRHSVKAECPETWGEMSEEQFLLLALQSQGGFVRDEDFFHIMFGIPRNIAKRLDSWYKYVLEKKAKYLRSDKPAVNHFFIKKLGKLKAPADMLQGVSLQQFMTVDTYFSLASEELGTAVTPKLDMMVASLYLQKNQAYSVADNDKKHKLLDLMANVRLTSKESADYKWAIYLNWSMIRNWLSNAYPLLFPAPDKEEQNNKKKQSTQWLEIYDSFVGDDIAHSEAYQTMERLMHSALWSEEYEKRKNQN